MKKLKQILALAGVVLLLGMYGSTLVFALSDSPRAGSLFGVSIGLTILVPVVFYAMLMVARMLEGRKRAMEPETKIKNIIFDVGNVLLSFEWDAYLESFGFPKETLAAVKRATYPNSDWEERDRGVLSPEEYFQLFLKRAPEYEAQLRQVIDREGDSLRLFDYSKTWIQYLQSKGYRVYLLSNISEHMLPSFYEKMDFLPGLDGAIFSCEVKMLKPEPEIYQALFTTYGLRPEECVFMDDRQENVDAAKAQGMGAFVFTDFPAAAKELEKYGIV